MPTGSDMESIKGKLMFLGCNVQKNLPFIPRFSNTGILYEHSLGPLYTLARFDFSEKHLSDVIGSLQGQISSI